jgi:hypothetical protein
MSTNIETHGFITGLSPGIWMNFTPLKKNHEYPDRKH